MQFSTYYTSTQLVLIITAFLFGAASVFYFRKENYRVSVFFLFASALCSRFVAASLDCFLNEWDEQFHALVAKNMAEGDLLTPILVKDTYLEYDYTSWASNHFWVHKQPWFLWQMALSMRLFGITEFSVRIPSAILSALTVLLVYRIGELMSNKKIAWYSALLFTFSFFQVNFVAGWYGSDHNDLSFMFYITASIWALFEFFHSEKKYWIFLVGLFAGIAILNKWLVGLLVYSGWVSYLLATGNFKHLSHWRNMALAFLTTLVVALPWQLYIFARFPREAAFEFEFSSRHFKEVMENHGGGYMYHLDQIPLLYGLFAPFLIVLGLYLLFGKSRAPFFIAYLVMIVLVYVFFTLAATKMRMFTLCVAPLVFISLGAVMEKMSTWFEGAKWKRVTWGFLVVGWCVFFFNPDELERLHSQRWDEVQFKRHVGGVLACKEAASILKDKKYAIFGTDPNFPAEFMFYTGQTAYGYIPGNEIIADLKKKKVNIAVFYRSDLPGYLLYDKSIVKLPKPCFWVFE